MSLKSCIAKAGPLLSQENREQLFDLADRLQASGLSVSKAERLSVRQLRSQLEALKAQIEDGEGDDILLSKKRAQDPAVGDRTDVSRLPKGREIPESVAVGSLEESLTLARSKSYARGRDLKMDVQERVLAAAKAAKVDLSARTKATHQFLSDMVVADAQYALQSNENAVGWYDTKVSRAIGALSTVHPEIDTDPRSRLAFLWALATTSNGLKVGMNFTLAEKAYRQWKESGTMPSDVGIGNAAGAINDTLTLFNELVQKVGSERLAKFVSTTFTVGEIERMLGHTVTGEWKSTPVRGAALLGPKIGNGFFSNLNGYFDALTMDRWLMRTWGRMTGTLVHVDPAEVARSRKSLQSAVSAMTDSERRVIAKVVGAPVRKDLTRAELDALAISSQKASMKKDKREVMASTGAMNSFRKAANNHQKMLDGQKEAPDGPAERNWIRAVFQTALQRLRADGKDMTMSDLQALLWYPERRLYDAAKSDEDVEDGYEGDEAPDYANAARDLAVANGVSREDVEKAMDKAEARGTVKGEQLTEAEKKAMMEEFRAPPAQGVNLAFEVAPDPNDEELTAQWGELSTKQRAQITQDVRDAVLDDIVDAVGVTVTKTVGAIGGYAGHINPNLITEYKVTKVSLEQARALAAAIGTALDQDSVALVDPRVEDTVGMVRVTLNQKAEKHADRLYEVIHAAVPEVDAFTARGNNFDILNFTGMTNEELAGKIDAALEALEIDGLEAVTSYGDTHSELVGKDSYESHLEGARPGAREEVRERIEGSRDRARALVAEGIADARAGRPGAGERAAAERRISRRADEGAGEAATLSRARKVNSEDELTEIDPSEITRSAQRNAFNPGFNPNLRRGEVLEPSAEEEALWREHQDALDKAGALWSEGRKKIVASIMDKMRAGFEKAGITDQKTMESVADSVFFNGRKHGQEYSDEHEAFAPYREAAARAQELKQFWFDMVAERVGPPEFDGMRQLSDFNRPITQTKAFEKWFSGSKVVDAEGNPLIVFHGTNRDFSEFRTVLPGDKQLSNNNWMGELGSWFASPSMSSEYETGNAEATAEVFAEMRVKDGEFPEGAAVYPVFLSIKNPYETEGYEAVTEERDDAGGGKAFREKLIAEGYDGVVIRDSNTDGGQYRDDWIAFYPHQIKSALGNTEFNQDSGDITRSKARDAERLREVIPSGYEMSDEGKASMMRAVNSVRARANIGAWHGAQAIARGETAEPMTAEDYQVKNALESAFRNKFHAPNWLRRDLEDRGLIGKRERITEDGKRLMYELRRRDNIDAARAVYGQDPEITRSAPRATFYSQLEVSLDSVPERLSSMSAPQWKLWLDANASKLGVKKEEIEWSGIKDYLAMRGKDKVSKDDLVAFVRDNGVQVKDVVLNGQHRNIREPEMIGVDDDGEGIFDNGSSEGAKYAGYTVPGGENYRELLITLPDHGKTQKSKRLEAAREERKRVTAESAARRRDGQPAAELGERYLALTEEINHLQGEVDREFRDGGHAQYMSGHWSEPNVAAHIRVDDRVDSEGRKVLFIHEIQSDWAQQGRKRGFKDEPGGWMVLDDEGDELGEFGSKKEADAFAKERGGRVVALKNQNDEALPPAPFVKETKDWVSLALKRAIMMAVEGGYDRVAFVTGEQAADFFDLSKQVSRVALHQDLNVQTGEPVSAGMLVANDLNGKEVISRHLKSEAEIEDLIGKEVAARLLQAKPQDTKEIVGVSRVREISGLDLKVGGEGMRGFYDKIVPQVANDVLKKIGGGRVVDVTIGTKTDEDDSFEVVLPNGKVIATKPTRKQAEATAQSFDGATVREISFGQKQPGFDITDSMREKLQDGMPLFSTFRDMNVGFGYKAADWMDSSKNVGWWDKTVGTPYHLAQKHPMFKRVFDALQNGIADVSKYATRAADMAPSILPKLEHMKDLFKSPLSAEDVEKLADPIFKGTLVYTRDADGNVVEAESVGDAGIVWTPDELRERWGLSGEEQADGTWSGQIGLYKEFRKATNKSIADLAITNMVRYAGADAEGVRGRVLEQTNVKAAASLLGDHLATLAVTDTARANTLQNAARVIKEMADDARGLMAKGYAPLSRFGDYAVYAPGIGEHGFFEMFENERDANRRKRQLEAEFPKEEVTVGTIAKEVHQLFKGITPETLALFGDALGLEESANDQQSQVFQEYLRLAKSTRSALKHLIERKGVEGYSNDVGRVLAAFVYSNARQASQNLNASEVTKALFDLKESKQGDLFDHAMKLAQYAQNPQEEAQTLRGLTFLSFIGWNVASAAVNLTQSITTTWPTLGMHFGIGKAGKAMADALGVMKNGAGADTDLEHALKRAALDGITDPNETHYLQGQAQGSGTLKSGDGTKLGDALAKMSNGMNKLLFVGGKAFGLAEVMNRKIAFISAYSLARDKGVSDPYAFAKGIVADTQFLTNKGNNPMWARGPVGATVFQFKKFAVAYLENLERMWGHGPEGKKAVALSLAILFFMAGLGGFPGADDLDDLIDGFAQRVLNKSFSSKMAKKEFFTKLLGDAGSEFVLNGFSGIPGVPIDVSGRLGMANLLPGTGLAVVKQNYGRDVQELFGAAGSMAGRALEGAGALSKGDVSGAVNGVLPVAAANVVKAVDMATMGQYRDQKGRKVIDTTMAEAVMKGLGFQPSSVKNVQDATQIQQELIALNKQRETEIADLWAKGRIEKKPDLIEQAKQQLKDWNASNPDSPISLNPSAINSRVKEANMTKAQRLAKTAPKEMRAGVKAELQREIGGE